MVARVRGYNQAGHSSGTSLFVPFHASTEDGDTVIIGSSDGVGSSLPSGWTNIVSSSAGSFIRYRFMYKVVNSTDVSTGGVTVSHSSGQFMAMAVTIRGATGAPSLTYNVRDSNAGGLTTGVKSATGFNSTAGSLGVYVGHAIYNTGPTAPTINRGDAGTTVGAGTGASRMQCEVFNSALTGQIVDYTYAAGTLQGYAITQALVPGAAPNPPGVPTALDANSETTTSVDVDWAAAISGGTAEGYKVNIDGGTWTDVGLVLTNSFTGLTPDTTYTFGVRGYNEDGDGTPAYVDGATEEVPPPEPEPPTPPVQYLTTPPTTPELLIDGVWLSSTVAWGNPVVTTRQTGPWALTFATSEQETRRPAFMRRGATVEARLAGQPIWAGFLSELDWDQQGFAAVGAYREAETVLCLDAGATTSIVDDAIDDAISRGALTWTRPVSIDSDPFGDTASTDRLNYVADLLEAWASENEKVISVDANRVVTVADPATTPSWFIAPGIGVLGVSDENYVTHLYGRYRKKNGKYATVTASADDTLAGRVERRVDLTTLGRVTSGKAQSVLDGILAKTQGLTGWVNGVTVTAADITTPGGVPAHLGRVVAGQMVRLLGAVDPRGMQQSIDVIVAETVWDVAEGTITLSPAERAADNLKAIVEGAGGRLL